MSKLVVAGLAYSVDAESEEEAEDMLLHFLDSIEVSSDTCHILKLWVSARQDSDERVRELELKEKEAFGKQANPAGQT